MITLQCSAYHIKSKLASKNLKFDYSCLIVKVCGYPKLPGLNTIKVQQSIQRC